MTDEQQAHKDFCELTKIAEQWQARALAAERERDEARQIADDLAWAETKKDDYAAMLIAAEARIAALQGALRMWLSGEDKMLATRVSTEALAALETKETT